MAYSWARRNELAAARGFGGPGITPAGARRNANAAAKGYQSSSAMTRLRAVGRPLPTDIVGQTIRGRRQIDHVGSRVIVETTSGGRGWGVVESQLRAAGGEPVTARVVWTDADGKQYETPIWSHGYKASSILRGAGGDLKGWMLRQLTTVLVLKYRFKAVPVAISFAQFTIGGSWPKAVAA